MKIRRFVFAAALLAAAIPLSPSFGQGIEGSYIALRGTATVSAVKGVTENAVPDIEIRHDRDVVAVVGLAYGYGWAARGLPIRTEVEYQHRFRFDLDWRLLGAQQIGFENNLRSDSVLVTAVYDLTLYRSIVGYAGGGIGWTRNWASVDRVEIGVGLLEERTDTTDNFTWTVMTGVTMPLAPRWRMEIGYRYIDLGEVKSGPFLSGTVVTADSYTTHDYSIGLIYRF